MEEFNLDDYLARLHYTGTVTPTEDRLEALYRAQYHTIPFENFDILLGRGISLEPAAIFGKLVRRGRGGYCFELNGLFLMALQAFGFDARALLARVHLTGKPSGRGHQISLVSLEGRQWVVDVGFGNPSLRAPLPLELDRPATHCSRTLRLTNGGPFGIMLQALKGDRWQDLYSFDLGQVYPADIAYGNHYSSTHPSSFFTQARMAILPLHDGVVTLFNHTLKRQTGEKLEVREVAAGGAYLDALETHFGIDLDAPYEALPPLSKADQSRKFKDAFPDLG